LGEEQGSITDVEYRSIVRVNVDLILLYKKKSILPLASWVTFFRIFKILI